MRMDEFMLTGDQNLDLILGLLYLIEFTASGLLIDVM